LKIDNRSHISLTPDDIKEAIKLYLQTKMDLTTSSITETKFIVKDVYAGDSLTGYYFYQFQGAETIIEKNLD